MFFLCSGRTDSSSKIGQWPCKECLCSLRRPCKRAQKTRAGAKATISTYLKKQTSASFTFAERAPQVNNGLLLQTWEERAKQGGMLHLSCLHILCCPFRSRSSSEQKLCGCLELLPLFHLDIKSLKPKTFLFSASHNWRVSPKCACLSKPGHL